MRLVYNLIMIDEESIWDMFNIGYFSSRNKAEKTAKRYLTEVEGFKDYNVTYQITEKYVIGCSENISTDIFIICGWNENEDLDEIDIIESDCYVNKKDAEQKLNELKTSHNRRNWCIDKYIIDECKWQEGFIKEFY